MGKIDMKLFPKKYNRRQNHFVFKTDSVEINGTYLKRDMETFAINILKALGSKKLKKQ